MRIAFISPSFYPAFYYGGPIYSTFYNALELSKLGVKVYVSTTDTNGLEKLNVEKNKYIKHSDNFFIKYYSPSTSKGFSYRMIFGLWKDISESDKVYTQSIFSITSILVLLYAKILKKKVLLSPRGQLENWSLKYGSGLKKTWLIIFIRPFAGKIKWHATSEKEKQDLLTVFPTVSVVIISNGISLEDYKHIPSVKDRSFYKKYTDGKTFSNVIVSMGRLHSVKGFDILINAFAEIVKLKIDAVLLIAGEEYGEKINLLNLISKLGLKDHIFLVGQIDDTQEKIKFLANADVFALASHNENFGIVYAEALAAGTPIVASKNTPWEIAETYRCGKWVNNTSDDFKNAIIDILNSDTENFSKSGIRLIEEKFGWSAISKKFKDVFDEMVKGKS
jgi:glycosyltransferase involved in cell wall biosynthesis